MHMIILDHHRMHRPLRLNLNWKLATFSVTSLALFVYLGIWQLDREDEKLALMQAVEARVNQIPLSTGALLALGEEIDGLPVRINGHYTQRQPLLKDNVVLAGRVGFEVLALFIDEATNMTFLVNRGFVPMGKTRDVPPLIPPTPFDRLTLTAHIYVSTVVDRQYAAGELIDGQQIVQSADPRVLQASLGSPVYPYLLRLDEATPTALPRYWPVTSMSPEKHRGYAVQWFLMAIAVVIAFSYFTFKSEPDDQPLANEH
jgi:surfeit locus 1 family protein